MIYLYSYVASHSLSYISYRIFIVMLYILCVTLYVKKNIIIDIGITVGASVGVIYASEFHDRKPTHDLGSLEAQLRIVFSVIAISC